MCSVEAQSGSQNKEKLKSLKAQLRNQLERPLIPKGLSRKYIANGETDIPAIMIKKSASKDKIMPTVRDSSALEDLKSRVQKRLRKRL